MSENKNSGCYLALWVLVGLCVMPPVLLVIRSLVLSPLGFEWEMEPPRRKYDSSSVVCFSSRRLYFSDDSLASADLVECAPGTGFRGALRFLEEKAERWRRDGYPTQVHFPVLRCQDLCREPDPFERVWLIHPLKERGYFIAGRLECKRGRPVSREDSYEYLLALTVYDFYMGSFLSTLKPDPNPFRPEWLP